MGYRYKKNLLNHKKGLEQWWLLKQLPEQVLQNRIDVKYMLYQNVAYNWGLIKQVVEWDCMILLPKRAGIPKQKFYVFLIHY